MHLVITAAFCVHLLEIFSSLDILPVSFNAVFTLSRLSFYGQLLEQLSVASLSHPTVCLHCYSLLSLLYFGQIYYDDNGDEIQRKLIRDNGI